MYNLITVVKFNNEYFENGDVVAVTKKDGTIIVGSIIIKSGLFLPYISSRQNEGIYLDTSNKFEAKVTYISQSDIANIQKVNQ